MEFLLFVIGRSEPGDLFHLCSGSEREREARESEGSRRLPTREGGPTCAVPAQQSVRCQYHARMGPAHVERYIGPCLFTSGYKPRYRRYPDYPPTAYTQPGYLPLSLLAVSPRKKEDRSPLSRLAIHTQGAPLIQSGRGAQGRRPSGKQAAEHRKPQPASQLQPKEDEPANSENSLPRIIKPRKRRKKERKPQQESAIVTLKPYTPLCADLPQPEQEPSQEAVPEEIERVAECQCRYCDPLGVIWEARAPAAWPNEDLSSEDSSSSGSGLEVSSEIVTSPNGHRDIEIRFFTTPPPPTPRPQPVVVSPPWR